MAHANPEDKKRYQKEYRRVNRVALNEKLKLHQKTTMSGIATCIVADAKHRSKKYGMEFDLTRDFALGGVTAAVQSGRCTIEQGPRKVSIDRIDNSRGYTMDNVQFIPQWLNYAYHTWDKKTVDDAIAYELRRPKNGV